MGEPSESRRRPCAELAANARAGIARIRIEERGEMARRGSRQRVLAARFTFQTHKHNASPGDARAMPAARRSGRRARERGGSVIRCLQSQLLAKGGFGEEE